MIVCAYQLCMLGKTIHVKYFVNKTILKMILFSIIYNDNPVPN